ncbi:hypothetical protein [Rhizobium rhizogenes]|uniref:Uncharacterized protein n=1 Tax=Rhizobium rhizogenes (strain K84 / ATCC BAA-868) TaxID=311403 RepID=B9J8Z1_RHIR8|nr:hypothetical protein Arad_3623 [Rhizobium rhizogenes K84]
MTLSDKIALIALIVSLMALLQATFFWRRSFRPIVTAMVKTVSSGNVAIVYNLTVQNAGTIPARNISLHIHDSRKLEDALNGATAHHRRLFLKCFEEKTIIPILQNGAEISCSFGFTNLGGGGFWKHHARIPIWVRYEGWFGKVYLEEQEIIIADSTSFTGASWKP